MATDKRRHPGYDNCKMVFMFYVVLWHMLNNWYLDESIKSWPLAWRKIFKAYALWHEKLAVPGFSFLSGYFGKGFNSFDSDDPSSLLRWRRIFLNLLVGSLNVQLFEIFANIILEGIFFRATDWEQLKNVDAQIQFWDHLETWYLMALLVWRLSTPMLKMFQNPLGMSMIFALLSGHISYGWPAEFRMRVFHFFPFYVAGIVSADYSSSQPKWKINKTYYSTMVGLLGIVTTIGVCWMIQDTDKYLGIKYCDLQWDFESHAIFLGQYIFCGIIVASVILAFQSIPISLFPWGHGNSTMAIYVWHWHVLTPLGEGKYPFTKINILKEEIRPMMHIMQNCHPMLGILFAHFLSYIICVILGNQWVWDRLLKLISAPECTWMFHPIPTNKKTTVAVTAAAASSPTSRDDDLKLEQLARDCCYKQLLKIV